ncbi:MAG: GatB/YqeY domain-containing protein [Pseudomonadota bacterium]
MRDAITNAMKDAMRAKESARVATLRLVNAAIKDRDIAARSEGNNDGVSDADILSILAKMIKQRQESAKVYEEAGRLELAEAERGEILIIEEFLPKQLSADEIAKAVREAISETGAESIRDMGKVMGFLKDRYAGQMDFGVAGGAVKKALS